ncbi:uncharacterized protein BDV14DRAFT_179388 [Aspergillus stella-maris]|uniref:uncharacterized protein n=1 Tax=Aspergillus stella-maris TaxID=1810926 RepID=UPI003CCCE57C
MTSSGAATQYSPAYILGFSGKKIVAVMKFGMVSYSMLRGQHYRLSMLSQNRSSCPSSTPKIA